MLWDVIQSDDQITTWQCGLMINRQFNHAMQFQSSDFNHTISIMQSIHVISIIRLRILTIRLAISIRQSTISINQSSIR